VAEGSVISKKPRTDLPTSEQQIFFSDEDLRDVQTPHDDPLSHQVENWRFRRQESTGGPGKLFRDYVSRPIPWSRS
jgi:hypothetical protein